jgi:hypothetical protein
MEWADWQYVSLSNRERLPNASGVYVVVDAQNFVWYVGQAKDLRIRWSGRNHHRYPQLIRTNRKLEHKIYWHLFSTDELNEKEQFYINLFNPELNGCKVKTYLPKQPQVDREIKRLFKVLSKTTMLFPVIRSIIVGEYEDEEGTCCILTVISLNDFSILGNSATKRNSPEVRKAWCGRRTYCGRDEAHYHNHSIPMYSFKGQKFEFIAVFELLQYLENPDAYAECVEVVQMFDTEVKALRDLSILDALSLEEEYTFSCNGKKTLKDTAYLNYRKPLLTSLLKPVAQPRTKHAEIYPT